MARKHVCPIQKVVWNTISLRDGWTAETVDATLLVAGWLKKKGYSFLQEPKMLNGLRPDFFVPELYEAQVIELMDSEKAFSLEKKIVLYKKSGLSVAGLPANKEVINALEGLKRL